MGGRDSGAGGTCEAVYGVLNGRVEKQLCLKHETGGSERLIASQVAMVGQKWGDKDV